MSGRPSPGMMVTTMASIMVASTLASGCGDDPARVSLVPVGSGPCGRPSGATGLKVTAFTATGEITRAVALDAAVMLADFPDITVQLGVEVVIGDGKTGALGKTAPLAFAALENGAEIPIFMAPLDGFCPVGAMTEPRIAPLIARAGDAVLVAGGVGPAGPLASAELYDPTTATFTAIEVPAALREAEGGLVGAVLTPLADGRVVLTGGSRGVLTVFDPETRTFGPVLLVNRRAFHGAIALGDDRVLVAGGCAGVVGQTCDALALRSSLIYGLDGSQLGGPNLPPGSTHEGAQLLDVGIDTDGARRFVLAGGFGDAGMAARFALGDTVAEAVGGLAAQVVALDGGAVLAAFGPDGGPPEGGVMVVPPDGGALVALANAPALAGARLVALEDGSVLAIGGDPAGRVARYGPTGDSWDHDAPGGDAADGPGAVVAPTLTRLADGSVLVLGGAGVATAGAWVYRPSLVGPQSGALTILPQVSPKSAVFAVPDPSTIDRTDGFLLTSPDDRLRARALIGGPRMSDGSLKVTGHGVVGGIALIAQQRGPGHAAVAELVNGMPARLVQLEGARTLCTGSEPVALDPDPISAGFAIADGNVTVTVGDRVVLSCQAEVREVGAWGVAALGTGARVSIDAVTVTR